MAKNRKRERARREREARNAAKRADKLAAIRAAMPSTRSTPRLRSDDIAGLIARSRTVTKDLPIDLAMADIEAIAREVNDNPIVLATHAPEPGAQQLVCFYNAIRKSDRDGGFPVWGWTFHAALTPLGPYAWINHHGMWMPADRPGELVDVTPFPNTEKDRPALVDGRVAFLPAPKETPWISDDVLGTRPQRYFTLGANPHPTLVQLALEMNVREEQRLAADIAAALARANQGK